jgi:hypothetical protein
LEDLRGGIYAEQKSFVPSEAEVWAECGDVPAFFCKFKLMVARG